MQPCFLLDDGCEVVVEVLCRVGERCEDEYLLVVAVDGMAELFAQVLDKHVEFAVVLGRDVGEHGQQQADVLLVSL